MGRRETEHRSTSNMGTQLFEHIYEGVLNFPNGVTRRFIVVRGIKCSWDRRSFFIRTAVFGMGESDRFARLPILRKPKCTTLVLVLVSLDSLCTNKAQSSIKDFLRFNGYISLDSKMTPRI